MMDTLRWLVIGFNWLVLSYALALVACQSVVLGVAGRDVWRSNRLDRPDSVDDVFSYPGTPSVTVLVPAFNEERTILTSVRSVLALRYPQVEAIVVDDGSTDQTFAVLQREFDLREIPRVIPARIPVVGTLLSVHVPRDGTPLLVLRKTNAGRVADALNLGLNAARSELVCLVDADSVIERDALLHVVRPFVEHPGEVIAAGGVIRPSNGVLMRRGSIEATPAPTTLLARAQVVEYLRAFLMGRVGWTGLDGLLIISGAFGIFRRDDVLAVGGLQAGSLGQDADLVADLHRHYRAKGERYRMVIVPQPVCWTEVPETRSDLARQRRRWATGLAQVIWHQRAAIGRPRFGRFGLLILPYHIVFEMLGPVVEVLGVPAVAGAWWFGLLDWTFAIALLIASVGFGLVLSLAALLMDDLAFHRYRGWADVGRLVVAALLECTCLRWLQAWWRLRGLIDAITPWRKGWGALQRVGFATGE